MFIGFLIVMAVLLPFFLFIQFLFPAMVARGKEGAAAGIVGLFLHIGLIYPRLASPGLPRASLSLCRAAGGAESGAAQRSPM